MVRDETIAIHGSYLADGTRAVAVPIYQTVAVERRMTSLEQGVGAVAFSFTEPPTRPGNKTSSRRGTNNEPPATSVGRTNP